MQRRKRKEAPRPSHEAYLAARSEAQKRANEIGADHGLYWNSLFQEFSIRMLPARAYRSGSELTCEVVMPERIEACLPGHGPAVRP